LPVTNITATQTLTWTGCTATTSGTLSANASLVDANVGGASSPTNTVTAALTVQTPAGVTATSVAPTPSTVNTGQSFTVTLTLAKTGTARANVTATSLTGAGTGISCTGAPVLPVTNITATQTLTWTGCTATTSGTLSANASWVDANVGGASSPTNTVTAALTVQTPAGVTASSLVTSPAPVPVSTTFSIILTLSKTGTASANVTAVSLTGTGVSCTLPILPINGIAASEPITWTGCVGIATPGQVTMGATATWTDVNVPGSSTPTAPISGTITVQ